MPEELPRELLVARLAPTDRLVELPALRLRGACNGAPPGLSTALRLGWREGKLGDRLLIRFDCRHRGIVASLREDNTALWSEDVVEAFVALGEPPLRYIELEINPLGAKFSAIVESPNLSREGMTVRTFPFPGLETRVSVREYRWSAVLSISLSEVRELLSTPRSSFETFRANFFRIDRTSGEFSALFPTFTDPPDFHRPDSFGRFLFRA